MDKLNHVFWGEIAPSDHFLQIYESDEIFLDSLEAFANSGFANDDGVIIIATDSHLLALNRRLEKNYNLNKLKAERQYIPIDAENALSEITNGDNIDEVKFHTLIDKLLSRVNKQRGGMVRVFGELVAILWGQGNRKAVIKLEKLWHELCSSGVLCLFCAYPKSGFRQDAIKSIKDICECHNNILENNTFSAELNIYGEKLSISST